MTLIRSEAKLIVTQKECPICKEGHLCFDGFGEYKKWVGLTPEQIPHTCTNESCLHRESLPVQYPILQHQIIPETSERIEE